MAHFKLYTYLLLYFIVKSLCIETRSKTLETIAAGLNGENIKDKIKIQKVEDNLWFPRGDKTKLSALSALWQDYYECSLRSLEMVTRQGQMPAVIVMTYVGFVARLPCSVCVSPYDGIMLMWNYAELSSLNKTFKPIPIKGRMTLEHNNLLIYNVKSEDEGLYRCQIGDSTSLVVLETVDVEEIYSVVKPRTSRGPYESPPLSLNYNLTLFSLWSPWSECSVCGKVGRRRRYGMCYVKLESKKRPKRANIQNIADKNKSNITLDNDDIELFELFPGGIPCRSIFLPKILTNVTAIQQRQSEIMIAMCKVTCEAVIFEAYSSNGNILETANNSAGIYSLHQVLPQQPPLPARDTIFTGFGGPIVIRCPGTTLADVPVTWRFGTKTVVPRDVDNISLGRIYINSRDHLVITRVLYRDANIYSCWQRDRLSGVVQLLVDGGGRRSLSQRGVLVLLVVVSALVLMMGDRVYTRMKRKRLTKYKV